jgi:hypothetical protein
MPDIFLDSSTVTDSGYINIEVKDRFMYAFLDPITSNGA